MSNIYNLIFTIVYLSSVWSNSTILVTKSQPWVGIYFSSKESLVYLPTIYDFPDKLGPLSTNLYRMSKFSIN